MPQERRPGWSKRTLRVRDGTFELFDQARKQRSITGTDALDQALREWTERKAAVGPEADLIAPALERLLDHRMGLLEDRLVKLLVKCGILSTTGVELFLEQRRRNGHDTNELLKAIRERVYRRWKDPRTFADTEPDPTTWGRASSTGDR